MEALELCGGLGDRPDTVIVSVVWLLLLAAACLLLPNSLHPALHLHSPKCPLILH